MEKCKRLWSLCHHPVWLRWLFLWILYKSQNPIGHCHNWWEAKVLSLISKLFCFLKRSILLSSQLSGLLQDIEKGNHDDKECEKYCKEYERTFGQKLPKCQFKGNKSKIQDLIQKVHIDSDGSVTKVQFDNLATEESEILQERSVVFKDLKNFWESKNNPYDL